MAAEQRPRARILIVDDHEDNVEVIRARLEASGYQIASAADGQEALECVRKSPPDLILLDVMMPRIDGMEVARQIKADESLPFIPIIMQTALDTVQHKVEGLGAGADDYVTKPINFAELEARVKSMLRIKLLQDELTSANERLARVNEELRRVAVTDGLTGLHNRRNVETLLHEMFEHSVRLHEPLACVMFDLDHFKSVNDVYGHAAGDAVLRAVARRLGSAVRRYDIVGRWGGEEFCVVVPGISGEQALRRVAETVRAAIAGAPVEIPDGRLLRVTASVGGALACEGLWSVEAIVDAADRALYAAKRAGRDCSLLVTELTLEQIAAEEPEAIRLAQALAVSASAREGLPESHVREVATLAGLIAAELDLTADAVMRCRLGGWLHDLGKVAIPDRVLVKPGLLDEEEWEVMRTHSEAGERIVNRIAGLAQAAPIVRHHHERMDGTGYPDGLQGDEIPIEARIVAVADAYSALTTDRVYRAARSSEDAIAVLQASSGAHHDPRCVEALVAVLAERAAYRRRSLVR